VDFADRIEPVVARTSPDCYVVSFWVPLARAAAKTDIVIFNNGDSLTGEFKSLKRGQLKVFYLDVRYREARSRICFSRTSRRGRFMSHSY
jgi:hypothetical protein